MEKKREVVTWKMLMLDIRMNKKEKDVKHQSNAYADIGGRGETISSSACYVGDNEEFMGFHS